MKVIYTLPLIFLFVTNCAKTLVVSEQDLYSHYHQQIVQSTLENFINKRLNKKKHPPTSTVIQLNKNNLDLILLNKSCDQCYTLKKQEGFFWTDKAIHGYEVKQTRPSEGNIAVTFIVSDVFTKNNSSDPSELILHYYVHSRYITHPNYFIDVYTINEGKATLQKTLPLVIY